MYDVEYAIVATRWVLAATNLGWCSKRGLLEDEWAEIRWGNVIDEPPPRKWVRNGSARSPVASCPSS
jgi:hypothetical protein